MQPTKLLLSLTLIIGSISCTLQEDIDVDNLGQNVETLHGSLLDDAVRVIAHFRGMQGHPSLDQPDLDQQEQNLVAQRSHLGELLFYDKILSGVNQTTCATCHHGGFMYADGRNIARGVFCADDDNGNFVCQAEPSPGDGNVVGPARTAPLNERNTPSVVNSALFPKQMLNGRFHFVDDSSTDVNELDASLGFNVQGPENVLFTRSLLGAQAFKPTPSAIEMAGDFLFGDTFGIQAALAVRVTNNAEYHSLFESAYPPGANVFDNDPEVGPGDDIEYTAVADAIAHFQEQDLILTDAPWDRFLAGDDDAISRDAKIGAVIFMTTGKCTKCHAGDLFSDFENYNIGVPQLGPGTARSDPSDPAYLGLTTWDFGLEEISGERGDRFKFRAPPLRGVALGSPFMHNGAYTTLEDAIGHHSDPAGYYAAYDISQIEPDMQAIDGIKPAGPVFDAQNPVVLGDNLNLSNRKIAYLIEFLVALTDERMLTQGDGVPQSVPSGLPVDVLGPASFPIYE